MSTLKVWDGTAWQTVSGQGVGVPTGGTAGQILTKQSATNYDATWQNNTAVADGSWTTFTPSWACVGAIGTGGENSGRYKLLGSKTVAVRFRLVIGSSGFTLTAAPLRMTAPVGPVYNYVTTVGAIECAPANAGVPAGFLFSGTIYWDGIGFRMISPTTNTDVGNVYLDNTHLAANTVFHGSFIYEIT